MVLTNALIVVTIMNDSSVVDLFVFVRAVSDDDVTKLFNFAGRLRLDTTAAHEADGQEQPEKKFHSALLTRSIARMSGNVNRGGSKRQLLIR
jgi:hypothetical protein